MVEFQKNHESVIMPEKPLTSHVTAIDWCQSRHQVAIGCKDGAIRVYDKDGKYISDLNGHRDFITSLKWSPTGQFIAAGSRDQRISIFDRKNGKDQRFRQDEWGWNKNIQWKNNFEFFGISNRKIIFDVSIGSREDPFDSATVTVRNFSKLVNFKF